MPPVQTRLPGSSSPSPSSSSILSHHHGQGQYARKHTSPLTTNNATSHHAAPTPRPPPYMVALSGWPEPVYIANRSKTGGQSFFNDNGDGVDLSSVNLIRPQPPQPQGAAPAAASTGNLEKEGSVAPKNGFFRNESLMSGSNPNGHSTLNTRKSGKESPNLNFPTSSTRTPTHSPPPQSSQTLAPPPSLPPPPPPTNTSYAGKQTHRHTSFKDPRFAPGVAITQHKPLTVAPNWTSSSNHHPSPQSPNLGVKVTAGQRGTGILVMRSVPDVYPPPAPPGIAGMAATMARQSTSNGGHIGLATEVYPRDPDSAFLWQSPPDLVRSQNDSSEEMEVEERNKDW